jgi:hypothetical protein
MSIVLIGSTSGSITLQEPAVAGSTVLTLPAATGTVMVSGNQPAFSAYLAGYQNITSGSYTKLTLDAEEFDTNNNFASSRFTPTVAGYYQLNACVTAESLYNTIKISIYKNGGIHKTGFNVQTNADQGSVSSLVYANGTTDYFEIYVFFGTTQTAYPSSDGTYFNGCMVRSA